MPRDVVFSDHELIGWEIKENSEIWNCQKDAFNKMFDEPLKHVETGVPQRASILYPKIEKQFDWSWYIVERGFDNDIDSAEEQLYNDLFSEDPHRIIYLTGYTGVGKSTFIHYFFDKYLHQKTLKYGKKLIAIKIPLFFTNPDTVDSIWDKLIYDLLVEQFDFLFEEQTLKNLAKFILLFNRGVLLTLNHVGDLICTDNNEKHKLLYEKACTRIGNTFNDNGTTKDTLLWLENDIINETPFSIGYHFNANIIKMLSLYYNYDFVLIVDNIDQLSNKIQQKICTLVHEKMSNYYTCSNVKFIILLRENFYEPVYTSTFLASFRELSSFIHLHPVNFDEILMRRKMCFYDPNKSLNKKVISIGKNITITIPELDPLIERVFNLFKQTDIYSNFCKLGNFNNRKMLDMVKSVFKSPLITKELLADVISELFKIKGDRSVIREFVSIYRFIDLLIRNDNYIIDIPAKSNIPNIYASGRINHFSSSLCRLYLMTVIYQLDSILISHLYNMMQLLGFNDQIIQNSINDLLKMEILFSPSGNSISLDENVYKSQKLESRDLTLTSFLLSNLCSGLYYFQRFAYVTPMQRQFLDEIPRPLQLQKDISDINKRIKAASCLYRQVASDFERQITYIHRMKDLEKRNKAIRIMAEYELHQILPQIWDTLMHDIDNVRSVNGFLLTEIEIADYFPPISNELLDFIEIQS